MTALWSSKAWQVVAMDVGAGVRHVSHNALALLGLLAVSVVVFLAGRADLRHTMEERVLGWLMERASARTSLAEVPQESNDILLAMAEPEAISRATALDLGELSRPQADLVNWISRRYSVAPEPIGRLVQEAWAVGQKAGVEPTLILAVMAIESGFNPFAQSHVGAQGLMQVMTGIHHDKYEIFGGRRAAFDPVTNLRVGVQVLQDCIRRAGGLQAGLKYYVGAANLAHDGGYAGKVLAEQAYLRDVAAGRRVPTTAPLPQAQPYTSGPVLEAAATPPAAVGGAPAGMVPVPVSASAPAPAPSVLGPTKLPAALPAAPAASDAIVPVLPVKRQAEQLALAG